MKTKSATLSLFFSSIALPLGAFVGLVVQLVLKTQNKNALDITGSLAYIRPTIISGVAVFLVLCIVSLVFLILSFKHREGGASKIAAAALVIVLLFAGTGAIVQKKIDATEKSYTKSSLENFFKKLQAK